MDGADVGTIERSPADLIAGTAGRGGGKQDYHDEANCGLRIADCGVKTRRLLHIPHSEIRNSFNAVSSLAAEAESRPASRAGPALAALP